MKLRLSTPAWSARARRWAALLPLVAALVSAAAASVYVAPQGSDASPGTRDQPLATLGRAVEIARALPPGREHAVILRGGAYWNVAVALSPKDSGLTIAAEPGETPVLHGGQRLTGWTKEGDRFFSAPLPKFPTAGTPATAGLTLQQWEVRLLLVQGQLRPRARYPERGELPHRTSFPVPWMSTTGGGWQRKPTPEELATLLYAPGALPADLEIRNAEITVFHMWDESCVGVSAHDPVQGRLQLTPAPGHPPGAFGVKKFVLGNTVEGMTRPGQWYHDRARNRVVYWPLPGEDLAGATEVVVPTRTTVLRLSGSREQAIRRVRLRGFTVAATTVPLIAGGFAAAAFDGALSVERAEECAFEALTIRGVAGHGINAGRGCTGIRVIDCEIADCGAGGVYVGGTSAVISNNHVHAVGRAYPSAIGIHHGGRNCVVSHNEVHDCTYSAINYGGTGNVVEHNLLYDCMQVLHDGAAIYMFAATNCILRGNVARDFKDTGGYGASAYYLDERSYGCIVESNLSLRVSWPVHNHMATNNVIRQNVFIVDGDAKLTFPRSTGYSVERNVIQAAGKIRIEGAQAVTNWLHNLFFSGVGQVERMDLNHYAASGSSSGAPGDTVLADPQFRDPARGDYGFQPTSPALRLGIQPIDVTGAGRVKR